MSLVTGQPVEQPRSSAADVSLLEPLSAVLALWDRLDLEIGDTAVVTDGHRWSQLAALVAVWYGALPVLLLTRTPGEVIPGVTNLVRTGTDEDARGLATLLRDRPGVAAAELTGEPGTVDVILEAMPSAARVMLAGEVGDRLTIDFYSNVHLKGLRLLSGRLAPSVVGPPGTADHHLSRRVTQLLTRPGVAVACRALLFSEPHGR
jgi:hypothetical protein